MLKKFLTYSLFFFIPVISGYLMMEFLTRQVPNSYQANVDYMESSHPPFQVLILGSSQIQGAVNPEWIDKSTLNLASGDQHHNTDFKLLKAFRSRMPQLETVVLEVSYSHFELPHNSKDFWKNSLYLEYYDVNCFERNIWFKDRLIYLSNPEFFSEKIHQHWTEPEQSPEYNKFGFNMNNYEGQFKELGHDETKITAMHRFKINTEPNLQVFDQNVALFKDMVKYLQQEGLKVIICQLPMYKTYHDNKNPDILRRRDSVVAEVNKNFKNLIVLDLENDVLSYEVTDFWNQSHLNPQGAAKFASSLNVMLNSQY